MNKLSFPASGSERSDSLPSSRPSRSANSAPAAITSGTPAGRITSWQGGSRRRTVAFHVMAPRPTAGRRSQSGSGSSTPSPTQPSAIRRSSCWPRPHGASCRSWAVSSTDPADRAPVSRSTRSASTAAAVPPFMSQAPLPVSRPPSTAGGTNGRCTVSRWPSNCRVRAGPTAVEADDDSRRGGMAGRRSFDCETVGREHVGQTVGGGPGLAGAAGHGDKSHGGVEQPAAIHGGSEPGAESGNGVHDRAL